MNLRQPPTHVGFEDPQNPEYHHPAWIEFWAEDVQQSNVPSIVGMLAALSRSRRKKPDTVFSLWADRAGVKIGRQGALLVITDQPLVFVSYQGAWKYKVGSWRGVLADKPTLGTDDTNLLIEITDYDHVLRWSGSAYGWGFGNPSPSGIFGLFETAPTTNGWQICDGSANIPRLNADGTTTNVTVPNVTTPRVLKGGLTAAAVAGYSGNTPTGTVSQPTFTGDAVAAASAAGSPDLFAEDVTPAGKSPVTTATGTVSQPTFTGNAMSALELPNKQAILYYRR